MTQWGGGEAEGGGVQTGNEREGVAVWEVGASVRVSICTYCNAILSVLNCVLNHVMCDRLESELELVCYCNAILFKLGHFLTV